MGDSPLWWLFLNLLSLIVLAFYSMMEMACVSFNRVRLHFYVSKAVPRALMINELLHRPSKLFGTTLVGVNVAMMFGSECAREFHRTLQINPDLAPLSQVVIVIIFGELVPMFAARSYSEHMALLGIPLLYRSSKAMKPLLWLLEAITQLFHQLIRGKQSAANVYLSQEELCKILEEQEAGQPLTSDKRQFDAMASSIFSLRNKRVEEIMVPLSELTLAPSSCTVEDAKRIFSSHAMRYLPIFHKRRESIVTIAFPRDLIRAPDGRKVRDYGSAPWFVTQTTGLPQILKQFKRNSKKVAVILDQQGQSIGMIHLDDLVAEIFGPNWPHKEKRMPLKSKVIVDRSFSGSFTVAQFEEKFQIAIDDNKTLTFDELIRNRLGHQPNVEDSIYIAPFQLRVAEMALFSVKRVDVTTKIE